MQQLVQVFEMYKELSKRPLGPCQTLIPYTVSFALDPPCVNNFHFTVSLWTQYNSCKQMYVPLWVPTALHAFLIILYSGNSDAGCPIICGLARHGINLAQHIFTNPGGSSAAFTGCIGELSTP
jgi:hypothetical protein